MPTDVSLRASSSTFCFAQLVGALGDAQLEPLERLAEPPGHRVEGDRQRSDLVVRRHGCFAVEVARRDGLGGVRDRQDRAGDPS